MTTTTNLGITLPTVGGDEDTWGTENNTAINAFDAVYAADGSGTAVGVNIGAAKTLALGGAMSKAAWTTAGVKIKQAAATYTDTSSSGTVADVRVNNIGAPTLAASSATTFTKAYGTYFTDPVAGTNVTLTNKYAIGADSILATTVNGSTLAVPTRQTLTSGTGATYTTPAGVRQLRIRMVGPGGGGGGTDGATPVAGANGSGPTLFNSIGAAAGGGGTIVSLTGGLGGTGGAGSASFRIAGNPGGPAVNIVGVANSPGGDGGAGAFGGAGRGGPVNTNGADAATNSGSGGGGGSSSSGGQAEGAGGGAGEYVELIINSPSGTYTYTVGTGGAGGSSTKSGGAGAAGLIIVDEFY